LLPLGPAVALTQTFVREVCEEPLVVNFLVSAFPRRVVYSGPCSLVSVDDEHVLGALELLFDLDVFLWRLLGSRASSVGLPWEQVLAVS